MRRAEKTGGDEHRPYIRHSRFSFVGALFIDTRVTSAAHEPRALPKGKDWNIYFVKPEHLYALKIHTFIAMYTLS